MSHFSKEWFLSLVTQLSHLKIMGNELINNGCTNKSGRIIPPSCFPPILGGTKVYALWAI
jgi:hypothetical protein